MLKDDQTRCSGRFGLRDNSAVCHQRESCARYLQLMDDAKRPSPYRYATHTILRDSNYVRCGYFIDAPAE